jgi:hypothetical protein
MHKARMTFYVTGIRTYKEKAPHLGGARTTIPNDSDYWENKSDMTCTFWSQAWFKQGSPRPPSIVFSSEKWL